MFNLMIFFKYLEIREIWTEIGKWLQYSFLFTLSNHIPSSFQNETIPFSHL
jgi:hypothetical protein